MSIPQSLQHKTRSIVNVDNRNRFGTSDGKCFYYSVLAGLMHQKTKDLPKATLKDLKSYKNPRLSNDYNVSFEGVTFPASIEDIYKFKKDNPHIILTVLGYEETAVDRTSAKKLQKATDKVSKIKLQNIVRKCTFPLYISSKPLDSPSLKHI